LNPHDHPIPKKRIFLRKWLRWSIHLFSALHFLLISAILSGALILYVAFRPDGLALINVYLLEPLGVHYKASKGSLSEGFTLYEVQTQKLEAKSLTLQYSLTQILKGKHTVDSIRIDGLRIHTDDFLSGSSTPWPFPVFTLKKVDLTNLQIISAYPITLNIHGENGSYDGKFLNFSSIRATGQSLYADAALEGVLKNNAIQGSGLLYPNAKALEPYSGKFTDLPHSLRVSIHELSDKRADLSTLIDALNLKQDPITYAEGIKLHFDYRYANDYLESTIDYLLHRNNDTMHTHQQLRYRFDGTTTTLFDGEITSSHPLPAHRLHGEITDAPEGIKGNLTIAGGAIAFASGDYDRFVYKVHSAHDSLIFLPFLPEVLQKSPLQLEAHGEYTLSASRLEGSAHLEHNHAIADGKFIIQENFRDIDGNLTLLPDAPTWKNWGHKPPEHFAFSLRQQGGRNAIQLSGDALALSLNGDDTFMEGSGNYLGNYFDLKASVIKEKYDLWIDAFTPSLFASISKITPLELHEKEYYDAEVRSKTHLSFDKILKIDSQIVVPWYAAVMDSKRSFSGTDGHLNLAYNEGNITISSYRFDVADHTVETQKLSKLHLGTSGELIADEIWIYDTLLLTGVVHMEDLRTSLRLQSERFNYKGPEGEAHMAADITFERDQNASQTLVGELTLLDGAITNLPIQQLKVMDEDIIIIQDVRPPTTTKLAINLHIVSRRPLHYRTKELDVSFIPDITVWKDPLGPVELLGMVTIPSGTATTGGKLFEIKPSEIYFGGGVPLNPYLNLTIGHEVDYKKIFIYVTHTLDSPIFLFNSDPVMSQNDIMSYILFGGPANTSTASNSTANRTGDTSTQTIRADATNFMLGAGIKGLISGATKIQIDTMNILTTQTGGMGIEVGARLNKDLRILYKNDAVSSVLIQYTLNRWLRLDADVHELGQGIKAVYIKDFGDFFPHNHELPSPKKP